MKINRKQLLAELNSVKLGLAKNEVIEQSGSFLFSDGFVHTFNDEIFAMIETSLKDIHGAISSEALLKILNKAKEKELDVFVKNNELHIKGKRFVTGIPINKEIKLPVDSIELPEEYLTVQENFSALAKLTCLTAGKSMDEPLLTCVHLNDDVLESCDNDRITICSLDAGTEMEGLIPAASLLQITNEEIEEIAINESWMFFKTTENVIFACRLFNEEYVDLSQYIPKKEGKQIEFPSEFTTVLERADVFSENKLTSEKMATINIEKTGKLTIETKNDNGWYKERAKINLKEPLRFHINIDFLKDVLQLSTSIVIVDDFLLFLDENSIHLIQLEVD